MSEANAIRIANVKYVGTGLQLIVRWTNNQEMTVSLEEPVYRLKGLRPLRTQAVFARAAVGEDGCSVAWPGDIDIGADRLWEMALEQNGHADAAEFIRWRWKHGLSLTAAAEALGLSRRTVAYYVSAEQEVPRTVLLALKGWEQEERRSAVV
jgi:hypothetical protein